jgi:DHA1 family tetracycline resistance protein-like MFS transporter
MTEPDPPATPRRAALVFVFVTVVLDMLALGMIVPVLPKLVESFMGGDTARAAEVYGLFGTVWALMQFLFSPVLGTLSDRWGRRPVILLSNLGLGLDYILMALAPTASTGTRAFPLPHRDGSGVLPRRRPRRTARSWRAASR